jgi:F-type H+-transporting ATPase subunit b
MISLDLSVIAAVFVFLTLVIVLNFTLFRPLLRVQAERESRTTGAIARADKQLQHCTELFDRYAAAIKNARMEGYRLQELARSDGLASRREVLDHSRRQAEALIGESRDSIRMQVAAARDQLDREAEEMARSITAAILRRPA